MSRSHPIISITGSSGAGTTSVKRTFENIFRREKVAAAYIEGDAFHRYNRLEMRTKLAEEGERGNSHFSHFSPETNLFEGVSDRGLVGRKEDVGDPLLEKKNEIKTAPTHVKALRTAGSP